VGKRGSIESLESGDHADALGLAGDLAVVEKSPARVASAVRKKNLTAGVHCVTSFPPFLLFKSGFLAFLQKSYLLFLRSKNCETNFVVFLEMASFYEKYKMNHVSRKIIIKDLILLFLDKFISLVILLSLL